MRKNYTNNTNEERTNRSGSNSSSNIYATLLGNNAGNAGDVNNPKVQGISPVMEIDPFKRSSRLSRSALKMLSIEKPSRTRSSPPKLQDNTPQTKAVKPPGDNMSELGEEIKKLTEMMRPPQRTINNNLRDLVGNITKTRKSLRGVPKDQGSKTEYPKYARNNGNNAKNISRRKTGEKADSSKTEQNHPWRGTKEG
ncbi:uncharacterized protein LOC125777560 [Bactrocera dorsalis]|uniref:Uncharacterized protein LOC125777560 n=1 Tax=Bactrocera dorsalis TaxID=27457 RepID=A0ABM3JHC0_BACDO|nr:uncharacterized protein LOC125777560 [Bactrocera dorsalis]